MARAGIPDASVLGGYPCFVLSIALVGLITFFVQESARTVSCAMGIPQSVAAITLDFPLDVALKRNMAAPTTSPVPRVGATLLAFRLLRDRGFRVVFAGLGVKSCEFGVSYACTGYVSTLVR